MKIGMGVTNIPVVTFLWIKVYINYLLPVVLVRACFHTHLICRTLKIWCCKICYTFPEYELSFKLMLSAPFLIGSSYGCSRAPSMDFALKTGKRIRLIDIRFVESAKGLSGFGAQIHFKYMNYVTILWFWWLSLVNSRQKVIWINFVFLIK